MGINQSFLQPAAIADNILKSDYHIAGFNSDITNDGIHFRTKWLLYPTSMLTNDDWWDEYTYIQQPNGKDKNMFLSQSGLGPGFMVTLSPKHAIGFTSRVRSILNIDGMDEPLFRLLYSNFQEAEYYNQWYFDKEMRASHHIFGDYGLTYARIIPFNSQEHFLKAGITLKLLQGIASAYMQMDDLYYYFNGQAYPGSKDISFNSSYVYSGLSDNWGYTNEYGSYTFSMNYQWTAKPSVGLDFGVIYEFRKDVFGKGTVKTDPDGKSEYFFKVGLSVLDLGRLKYEKDYYSSDYIAAFTPDYQQRYNSGDNSVPASTDWLDMNDVSLSARDYADFSYAMHQIAVNDQGLEKAASNQEKFTFRLPSSISLQADLNLDVLLEGLYVNYTSQHAIYQGYRHVPNSHYIGSYSITPRIEKKWWSLAVPVQVDQYGKLNIGLGIRAGIFYAGVNNLFTNVFNDPYGMHAYVGVKVPIHHKDPTKVPKPKEKAEKLEQPGIQILCICCGGSHEQGNCLDCYRISNDTSLIRRIKAMAYTDSTSLLSLDPRKPVVIICCPNDPTSINIVNSEISIGAEPGTKSENKVPASSPESPSSPPPSISPASSGFSMGSEINFETAKSALSASDMALLDDFAAKLKAEPAKRVQISGHTDNVGADEANMTLSKRRAESTASYLISRGVQRNQLEINWYGESQPLDDNNTPQGRQNNRRVEVELIE
jgi:outer membrane protein OmpA-like peptidoglycan-associated protein